ncbi:MAG: FadR/GntR family transcriptional regulator [Candidatus Dormibacteria bacterium]
MAGDAVRIPKAAELVARGLRSRILRGELPEGAPLPPEGQLLEQFRVARTTVREAFRILESEGLLVVRRGAGGGARVWAPSEEAVARYTGYVLQFQGATLADVHQARTRLEAPLAALLARRSGDEEMVRALRDALREEAEVLSNPDRLPWAEGRFHRTLVRLTGNRTVDVMSAVVNRIFARHVARFIASHGSSPETRAGHLEAHRAHERLVELIEVGAEQEAEALWRRHLEAGAERILAGAAGNVLDIIE